MKFVVLIVFMISVNMLFSQEERVYINGSSISLYNKEIDLKNKLPEDKVFFSLELELTNNLSNEEIERVQNLIKTDDKYSFLVMDSNSSKITFFLIKKVISGVSILDYCKDIMNKAKCKSEYKNYKALILEFVI